MYPRSGGFGLIAHACNVQSTEASTLNRGSLGVDENDFSVGIVTSIAVNAGFELIFLSGFEVGDIDEV